MTLNFSKSFEALYNSQKATALQSSSLVRENGISQFSVTCSVNIDGYRSVETYVSTMNDDEGIVRTYRQGPFSTRLDEHTIDLAELAAL